MTTDAGSKLSINKDWLVTIHPPPPCLLTCSTFYCQWLRKILINETQWLFLLVKSKWCTSETCGNVAASCLKIVKTRTHAFINFMGQQEAACTHFALNCRYRHNCRGSIINASSYTSSPQTLISQPGIITAMSLFLQNNQPLWIWRPCVQSLGGAG